MSLGAFRAQITGMAANLDAALQAVTRGDVGTLRAQYSQFASGYAGVSKEIAELYPIRCPRLIADRIDGDAAVLVGSVVNLSAAAAPVAALRAGVASIAS